MGLDVLHFAKHPPELTLRTSLEGFPTSPGVTVAELENALALFEGDLIPCFFLQPSVPGPCAWFRTCVAQGLRFQGPVLAAGLRPISASYGPSPRPEQRRTPRNVQKGLRPAGTIPTPPASKRPITNVSQWPGASCVSSRASRPGSQLFPGNRKWRSDQW